MRSEYALSSRIASSPKDSTAVDDSMSIDIRMRATAPSASFRGVAAADAAVKSIDAVLSLNELLPGVSVKMVSPDDWSILFIGPPPDLQTRKRSIVG